MNGRWCKGNFYEAEEHITLPVYASSSSIHGLGESSVPASSTVVSLSIIILVYLCLIFRMVDIYMPVVECGSVCTLLLKILLGGYI
jgi:hypothetical protein